MKEEIINNEETEIVEGADALDNNPIVAEETVEEDLIIESLETGKVEEVVELNEEEVVVEKTDKEKFIEFAELEGYEFAKEHYGKSESELLKIKNDSLLLNNNELKEENKKLKKTINESEAISFSEEEHETGFKAIVDAHIVTGLSVDRAYSKAIKENPELYKNFMSNGGK